MKRILLTTAAAGLVLVLAAGGGPAVAGAPAAVDPLAQQLRLQERLEAAGQLTEPQRTQMRINLEACRTLGLSAEEVGLLFPGDPDGDLPPATALRLQSVVLRAARGEMPVDPLLAKIREGRMKHAPDAVLVQASEQVTDDMFAAAGLLGAAADDGLTPPADAEQRHAQVRTLTRAMWRGLTPEDGARLQERAKERLGTGPCATADLAAAAEVTVRIREQGGDPEEALLLAGAALARGYTAPDLVELGRMVTAGRLGGGDIGTLLTDLTDRVDQGFAAGALNRYLLQSGWMGPSDTPGAGGRQGGNTAGGPGGTGGTGGSGSGSGGTDQGGSAGGSGAGAPGGQTGGGS